MPYEIVDHEDGTFCVHKEGGEQLKCYDARSDAEDYMRALYAAENKEGRSFLKRIADTLESILNPPVKTSPYGGFKAYGDKWVAWWTNNFEDRDGEIFAEKAIDEYVARVDVGVVPMPELWFWHTPGTKHGQAVWVAHIGHYCVAAGSFDDTPMGRAAQQHYAKQGRKYAVSHGYTFDATQRVNGVYHQFNTFEISPLPADVAANPYTSFEKVKEMALDQRKIDALKSLFGDDIAESIITDTLEKSKAIEQLGAKYKDASKMSYEKEDEVVEDGEAPMEDDEDTMEVEAAGRDMKADLAEMYPEMVADVAELARIANALAERIGVMEMEAAERKNKAQSSEKEFADWKASVNADLKAIRDVLEARPKSAVRGESNPLPLDNPLRQKAVAVQTDDKLRNQLPGMFKTE